jgi:hypothetical protein
MLWNIRRAFPIDDAVLHPERESILAYQRFGELRAELGIDLRVGTGRLSRLHDKREEECAKDSEDHIRLVCRLRDLSHLKKSKSV